MLQSLRAPPGLGTLRESVLTLLMMKQETIEHARFRALAQITIDKEKGVEAFEEYMKIAFPYLEATKRRERGQHIERLNKEISKGLMVVKPLQTELKSRMKSKKISRVNPQSPEEEKQLYKKMGRSI